MAVANTDFRLGGVSWHHFGSDFCSSAQLAEFLSLELCDASGRRSGDDCGHLLGRCVDPA